MESPTMTATMSVVPDHLSVVLTVVLSVVDVDSRLCHHRAVLVQPS
jgi:hypothetical protein